MLFIFVSLYLSAFIMQGSAFGSSSSSSSFSGEHSYFSDWGMGGRSSSPTCIDIPKNLSLCQDIGYYRMRLPNLLDHDTLNEISQQSSSWWPLIKVGCHPDTQVFLCSLYCPVCLERPIYPCRSLCEQVRKKCEGRMITYGYTWPEMLKCEKFPIDNDMCISTSNRTEAEKCEVCTQLDSYENILDNYCRADFVLRGKFRRGKKGKFITKKNKMLKEPNTGPKELLRQLRRPTFNLKFKDSCCEERIRGSQDIFLIMGNFRENKLVPSFLMPWGKNSKSFKRAIRMFKQINCSAPKLADSVDFADTMNVNSQTQAQARVPTSTTGRRRRGKGKRTTVRPDIL